MPHRRLPSLATLSASSAVDREHSAEGPRSDLFICSKFKQITSLSVSLSLTREF